MHERGRVREHVGEEGKREADEAVGSHLQQDARQNHGARRGRFHVGVGEPGVEGEHRHFDGEGEEETEEQQRCSVGTVVGVNLGRGLIKRFEAEGVDLRHAVMVEVEEQDAQQHQHRTGQRIKEEFNGGVEFARASPNADEQVHRDEHGFPEDEEEEEIQRHEDAEHARLQHEEPDVVLLHAVLDGGP